MFKLLLCFWMTFLLVPSPSAADGEAEEGMTIIYPGQYFACAWEDAYWGDAGVYWEMLFPENPPFTYACIYLGSFDQEFGFYLDGTLMVRASSLNLNPAQMYCNWFFEGTPERRLIPYEGEPFWMDAGGVGRDYSPRVKREWMDMGKGLSRLIIRVLDHAASGEIAAGKAAGDSDPDSLDMVIIRGTDGKTRILTPQDEGFETVEKLLECAYSAYQDESVKDSAGYIMKHYDVLRGKTPPAGGCPRKECFGINGSRFDW